jgi:hypothetical protein
MGATDLGCALMINNIYFFSLALNWQTKLSFSTVKTQRVQKEQLQKITKQY